MSDLEHSFRFNVIPFDGALLVESIYPRSIDVNRLSETISNYYDLWDADEPILALGDVSKVELFPDDVKKILLSVLTRTVLQSNFVSAAWYTHGNSLMTSVLEELLHEMGRSPASIFETRDAAIEYLARHLERYRRK